MGAWFYIGIAVWILAILIGGAVGFMVDDFLGMLGGIVAGGFAGLVLAMFPLSMAQVHYNERAIKCHVTEKDRGGKDGGMRVYTSCGTFQNTDSILRGKNTSADIWARIHPGETQEFHVVGWRLGLTSDFPNILEVR
jgi:hypothetical protein